MLKYIVLTGIVALAGLGWSQPAPVSGESEVSGQSQVQMPEIGAPARPSEEEATGLMSGNKPFSLTTDVNGELMYNFDENNELESIRAKRGVVFTSEDMTLNADDLTYKTQTSELVASGKKVVVRQGDVIATCQLFKYFPTDQHSELSGTPILYNKSKDGKVSTTAGEKITIHTVNGRAQVKVLGGGGSAPRLSSSGTNPPAPTGGNARLTVSEPAPGAGAAPGTVSGASQAPAATAAPEAAGSQTGSGFLAVPSLSGPQEKQPSSAPKSNRIDPNNPADVESFTGKKKQ